MKFARLAIGFALLVICSAPGHTYRLVYKEQLYELNHQQLYMRPENYSENVRWLEMALAADFANPLYALAEVTTEREWDYYRDLFWMHLNLHLVNQYLGWASDYMKFEAYFFNYPWRDDNLASLERVDALFAFARYYWGQAEEWSDQASGYPWLYLEQIQNWEDQRYRIQSGELDYGAIIDRHEERLAEVREAFRQMDQTTY